VDSVDSDTLPVVFDPNPKVFNIRAIPNRNGVPSGKYWRLSNSRYAASVCCEENVLESGGRLVSVANLFSVANISFRNIHETMSYFVVCAILR
jgi:hypothetical protein